MTTNILMECVEGKEPTPLLVTPDPPKGLSSSELLDWYEGLTDKDYCFVKMFPDGSSELIPQQVS